ncbi:MAG: alkaline phosphatase D family protein [Haloferacaceae archaeon]
MDENGEFGSDPFTLGVASGDPLPTSVILWTRLAPNPLAAGGGMPDQSVDVAWTVATDEAMTDVVGSGTATAEAAYAHTVHVDAAGLGPNTEYYYQFTAGGQSSPVGRTKTAPEPGTPVDEFRFGFASCQSWPAGYYTAHRDMAQDELDLIIHLGDYIYEYGVGANGGARNTPVPQAYREETVSLERYRLQYALYKSAPGLKAAHASAPWLITRDDHEVDNNWADEVPQDPDEQSVRAFLKRRAAAFKSYYEHMPFRGEQKPTAPDEKPDALETNRKIDQKLYRNYRFGDLVEFNVLDTRQYRSDQACNDAFAVSDCQARFAEDRTILGENQRSWLLDNLRNSDTTWDVLANQLPIARMDFKPQLVGEHEEGFRTDQWDGYVADQTAVLDAFEDHVDNPVVVTGDFHRHWANDLVSAKEGSDAVVGAEFVGTSISAFGDGTDTDDFGRQVLADNDNVNYHSGRRGYTRCTVTPDEWQTDFRVVEAVTEPNAPVRTDATFTVRAGEPGLQPQPPTLVADSVAVGYGKTGTVDLSARWLPEGLAGVTGTLSLSDPEVASITGATVDDAFGISETSVADDGSAVTIRLADLKSNAQAVAGGVDTRLAAVDVRGDATGTSDVEFSVERLNDDAGDAPEAETRRGVLVVGPPTVTGGESPTDVDGDGLYEDLNGNGRLDYDDVRTLFDNFDSDSVTMNRSAYDFNGNGRLDFNDVVDLFGEVT